MVLLDLWNKNIFRMFPEVGKVSSILDKNESTKEFCETLCLGSFSLPLSW
jgi:hypothetical protein